jgi:ubiquinone/menaquinone biosynthesis C-methylase UbiE
MSATQEQIVDRQFGSNAASYVTSTVHATGEDLATLAGLVRARPGLVLDLGCGGGHVAYAAAAAGGQVVAYDLSPRMLAEVEREAAKRGLTNIATQAGPAERLSFADASFDYVFTRFSAHHWTDFDAGLREAARVLRPGGTAAFVDVISPGVAILDTYLQSVEVLRDTSHVRDRTLDEWLRSLAAAGLGDFRVTQSRLRMEFASWIARIGTPPDLADAIRALQAAMSERVRAHFAIEADGSFMLDVATIVCRHP